MRSIHQGKRRDFHTEQLADLFPVLSSWFAALDLGGGIKSSVIPACEVGASSPV